MITPFWVVVLSVIAGNFAYALMRGFWDEQISWETMAERSFFQFVLALILWFEGFGKK